LKNKNSWIGFILKEWLLLMAGTGFVLTSIYTKHLPSFSRDELQVLFILFSLFVAVRGLQSSGFVLQIAQKIERGSAIPLKLVLATFALSLLVTNDVALIVIVPLTLSLNIGRKDILVILEALAANAGSALTPFGNPQNLFIYWFYQLQPLEFIRTIAPFSLTFLVLLAAASFFTGTGRNETGTTALQKVEKTAYAHGILLVCILLSVLRMLPVSLGLLVLLFALLFDRRALRIDYGLLLMFLLFFGIANNVETMLGSKIGTIKNVFLLSAFSSQAISNVPAALLFSKFTPHWEALLWGVNTGGFGSLFGSLANLIAYRIYVADETTGDTASFTMRFLAIGYAAFLIAIGLYFLLA